MNCKLSVIIPVYNAEQYLKESIESVVASSVFNELEVLLIDDGSKDRSAEICDRFSQKYNNIRTFHIENGGVSNARNVALAQAKGDYITFCDADDYYLNDVLAKALQKLDGNDTDLLFFEYLSEDENGHCSRVTFPFEGGAVLDNSCKHDFFKYMLTESNFNSLWNKVFKRELIEENNITFNKEQRRGGDRDFVIKFLAVCQSAFYLSESGYFYRYVKTSIVNKPRTDHFDNICIAYNFKVQMAPGFGFSDEELKAVLEPAVAKQIILRTFSSSGYEYELFETSMKRLFENEKLMNIIRGNKKIDFNRLVYSSMRHVILKKQTEACWTLVKAISSAKKIAHKFR